MKTAREQAWATFQSRSFLAQSQDGTTEADEFRAVPMAADGSVIAVGQTAGSWDGTNAGLDDFAALRLDATGEEIWRYQVRFP